MISTVLKSVRPISVVCKRAASSTAAKPVEVPINLFGLEANYATALYKAATRAKCLAACEKDLAAFAEAVKSSKVFQDYLANPVIGKQHKAEDIAKIAKGMGLTETTTGMLAVLAENGRIGNVVGVTAKFNELMKAKNGIVEAVVTSAAKLTKQEAEKVKKAVQSKYIEKGKTLNLTHEVDPSIIGGLQLQIGETFLDLSTRSKINQMHNVLMHTK